MKDWRVWALVIGIYFLVKMCGGCEGCSGCSSDNPSNGKIKCEMCGKIGESAYEGSTICRSCDNFKTKKFNENWKKREKAKPVRPY